jgi:plastocyanin
VRFNHVPPSLIGLAVSSALLAGVVGRAAGAEKPRLHRMVIVPHEDRFTPFALTIRAGDSVDWVNTDTDDHTVVSDDSFNTAGHQGLDQLLPGTDSTGGTPGHLRLRFNHSGTFVYYCRFHAHLDDDHQPTAPGPNGGIQDPNGNFGTPMMGIITVLPQREADQR